MTTDAPVPGRRTADLAVSIVLTIVGLLALVAVAFLDLVLALTAADSPGDVEGATLLAFILWFVAIAVWIATTILAIVLLVRGGRAWWVALIGAATPLLAGIIGFVAVTSVVK